MPAIPEENVESRAFFLRSKLIERKGVIGLIWSDLAPICADKVCTSLFHMGSTTIPVWSKCAARPRQSEAEDSQFLTVHLAPRFTKRLRMARMRIGRIHSPHTEKHSRAG